MRHSRHSGKVTPKKGSVNETALPDERAGYVLTPARWSLTSLSAAVVAMFLTIGLGPGSRLSSEMTDSWPAIAIATVPTGFFSPPAPGPATPVVDTARSVSYTHLRAHETR